MRQFQKSSDLKNNAKGCLEGRWGIPVLATFVLFLSMFGGETLFAALLPSRLFMAPSSGDAVGNALLYGIFSLLFTFLFAALSILLQTGIYYLYLNMICGQRYAVSDMFIAFRQDFGKAAAVASVQALVQLLCSLPADICNYFFLITGEYVWIVFMLLALAGGLLVGVPLLLTLRITPLVLLDFPQYSVGEILRHSFRIMKGNRGRLFYIELSFLPLFLLCAFTLGIAYLWLIPYMQMTITLFYLDLMNPREA